MTGEVGETGEVNNLAGFVEAAKAYGVTGIECRKEGDNSVLEQNLGEGWRGLGYDKDENNLWIGLANEGHIPNQGWDGNTKLQEGTAYKGIAPGEQGMLAFDHPVTVLAGDLHKNIPDSQVHVTGEHVNWQINDRTRLKPDEKGNLLGNIPAGIQIKVAVTHVIAEWQDGGWKNGEKQKLTIRPTPTAAVK